MPLLDNAPATFDIITVANADLGFTLNITDANGVNVDLTNYDIVMQVRDTDNTIAAELSVDNQRITIVHSVATFTLPASANPLPQTYRYDILFISPTAVQLDPLSGNFIVKPAVTI